MQSQSELRQQITDQIIAALTMGDLPPWRKPWRDDDNAPGLHTSLSTGQPYRGINQLLLQIAVHRKGYQSKWWGTYKQIEASGSTVRRGEKATKVILWRPITRTRKDAKGEEVEDTFPLMREFSVFNAEQTTGLEQFRVGYSQSDHDVSERFQEAEELLEDTGADIRLGGNVAAYDHRRDIVFLPNREQFPTIPDFYDTAFHELVHWSERFDRLNWDRSKSENTYAMGELVAEMGACYIGDALGLPSASRTNHAAYLKGWLKAMKDDTRFIFKASSQASKAADYLLAFHRSAVREPAIIV